jgi:hypothetical protein
VAGIFRESTGNFRGPEKVGMGPEKASVFMRF